MRVKCSASFGIGAAIRLIGIDMDKSRYLDDRSGNIAFGPSRALHVVANGSCYCAQHEIDHQATAHA